MQHAVELGFALMARRLEVAYFRIDAKLRKRREQDALAAAAPVVVAGYEKPLVAAPGQAKAAAHRARLVTTEKDWVRLSPDWRKQVAAWPVEVRFSAPAHVSDLLRQGVDGAAKPG